MSVIPKSLKSSASLKPKSKRRGQPTRLAVFLFLSLAVSLLTACEREPTTLEAMSDHLLAERYGVCLDKEPTSPGKVQACENIRKECERRKTQLGSYVCRVY